MGKAIKGCMIREMCEETGLTVCVRRLLYVTDRLRHSGDRELDVSFVIVPIGGRLLTAHICPNSERIAKIRMVPIDELDCYGISDSTAQLIHDDFPNAGTYQGDFHAFYGCTRVQQTQEFCSA